MFTCSKNFKNILNKVNGNETKRGEEVIFFLYNLPNVMNVVSQENSSKIFSLFKNESYYNDYITNE